MFIDLYIINKIISQLFSPKEKPCKTQFDKVQVIYQLLVEQKPEEKAKEAIYNHLREYEEAVFVEE
jgi:hypothetical protein